jgi:hypothetical protein
MSDTTRRRLELDEPKISMAEELELAEELEPSDDDFGRYETSALKQKKADAEARLARIRTRERALETGQKVILGAFLLSEAREDPEIRAWLLRRAKARVTREADQKRLWPLLAELSKLPQSKRPKAAAISPRPLPPPPPVTFEREPASESRPLPRRLPSDEI